MMWLSFLTEPWPWYIAGPLIGLTVPLLLLLGNKSFGVSSNLRHICAACFPGNISFFKYEWKKEIWNLFFAAGIILGALLVNLFFSNPNPMNLNPDLVRDLQNNGINSFTTYAPVEIFSWQQLFSVRSIVCILVGGFFVGFGTRWAGGCTSGHSIMGLSSLQWPSLVATMAFMAGGFLVANTLVPFLLKL